MKSIPAVGWRRATPRELLQALAPFISGTADRAQATSPLLLQSPAALKGIGMSNDASAATYTLRKPSGDVVAVSIRGDAPDGHPDYTDPARNYAPQAMPGSDGAWRSALAAADVPMVLREPDASLFVQKLDDGQALYVHISMIMRDERGGLDRQLAAVIDAAAPGSLRYAVLDLRMDGGGDYMETLDFSKQLASRVAPDGKLFILTDRNTFSAAIVTLARTRYFAGRRAVVLGEHPGDSERFWAESGARLELPNSKIAVNFATGYHDWANGCGWRFSDYRRGVDTLMEEVSRRAHTGAA